MGIAASGHGQKGSEPDSPERRYAGSKPGNTHQTHPASHDRRRSESFYVKFSRTDKMYAFFSRIGAQIWNSIPYSIKVLKRSSFRKKIKELLLNFLRSEDEYVDMLIL